MSVRTVQRIEAGGKASLESLKSLASVLEVDISQLESEAVVIDKTTEDWQKVPSWLRAYFYGSGIYKIHERKMNNSVEMGLVLVGIIFLLISPLYQTLGLGFFNISLGYMVSLFTRAGDKYSIW